MHHESIDIIFYVIHMNNKKIEHIYNGKKKFSIGMVYSVHRHIIHHCRIQSRLSLVPVCKNGEHWRDETRLWRQLNKYGSFNKYTRKSKDFDKQSEHFNHMHAAMCKFIFFCIFHSFCSTMPEWALRTTKKLSLL